MNATPRKAPGGTRQEMAHTSLRGANHWRSMKSRASGPILRLSIPILTMKILSMSLWAISTISLHDHARGHQPMRRIPDWYAAHLPAKYGLVTLKTITMITKTRMSFRTRAKKSAKRSEEHTSELQ